MILFVFSWYCVNSWLFAKLTFSYYLFEYNGWLTAEQNIFLISVIKEVLGLIYKIMSHKTWISGMRLQKWEKDLVKLNSLYNLMALVVLKGVLGDVKLE